MTARLRRYTMIEMLVVTLIIAMLVALILPRLTGTSRRMTSEQALTSIRQAASETAARARATGRPLSLTLVPDDDGMAFRVALFDENLSRVWTPPMPHAGPPAFLAARESYPLPSSVEWDINPLDFPAETGVRFLFFPDGQAGGPELTFRILEQSFLFRIDPLSGKPLINAIP